MPAMNRRHFLRSSVAAGALAAAPPLTLVAAQASTPAARGLIKPKALVPGDTIGMVVPASMEFDTHRLGIGVDNLRALGFEVKVGENAANRHGYFAGTDAERASDINAMFADPEVDGIFAYTGGWGTPRLLPHLDYEMIRRNPKVIIGFSDITALVNAIHQRTGLVTFHGPNAASNYEPYTLGNMRRVIMSREPIGTLANPEKRDSELIQRRFRTYTIRGGKARGRLVGGNLTLLAALMGTPWEVDTDGAILFLEDTHEAIYRIDRMLTQLSLGGKFNGLRGVLFGYCTDCPAERASFSLEQLLTNQFAPLGIPVLGGLAFGHIEQKLTFPLGIEAELDADAGVLTIPEAAVV